MNARIRAAGLIATLAAVQAAPALACVPALRAAVAPGLAGTGRPDHVALTFDDGPNPASTPAFLAELDRLGVKATFFLLGRWVDRAPRLAAEIAAAGHELALHGYDHRCLLLRGAAGTARDLSRGRAAIKVATGQDVRWYRPPYGVLTTASLAVTRRLGLRPVLWSAWGRDWTARATADSVSGTVLADLRPGGTILLHDSDATSAAGSWRATLGALPRLVDACRDKGLTVGPYGSHRTSADHADLAIR